MIRALLLLAVAACALESPPSTDAGADPQISQCCDWYLVPLLYPRPQVCLDEHSDVASAGG